MGLSLTCTCVSVVANNFWGKEDAGVQPLLERMSAAKQTCDELRSFYAGMTLQKLCCDSSVDHAFD